MGRGGCIAGSGGNALIFAWANAAGDGDGEGEAEAEIEAGEETCESREDGEAEGLGDVYPIGPGAAGMPGRTGSGW